MNDISVGKPGVRDKYLSRREDNLLIGDKFHVQVKKNSTIGCEKV